MGRTIKNIRYNSELDQAKLSLNFARQDDLVLPRKVSLKSILLFVVFCMTFGPLLGCSEKATQQVNSSQDIQKLIAESDLLLQKINLGQLLDSTDERSKNGMITLLNEVKQSLSALATLSDEQKSLIRLHRGLAALQTFPLLQEDHRQFNEYFNNIGRLVYKKSADIGMDKGQLNGLSWLMHIFDFSNGLDPFYNGDSSLAWQTEFRLDEFFAFVGGSETAEVWLYSPPIDFSHTLNPSLRLKHNLNIFRSRREQRELDRLQIKNSAFKVKVSRTGNIYGEEQVWEDLEIPMPATFDFYSEFSPEIDLSPYLPDSENKELTIAFVYKYDHRRFGRHNVTLARISFQFL